jgi:phosphotransferase system HPr (HPr) family protein
MESTKLIRVTHKMGLHARPSSVLVRLAMQFQSQLFVSHAHGNEEVDAKSVMDVMMLAIKHGDMLKFRAVGSDSKELLDAIDRLFLSGFTS